MPTILIVEDDRAAREGLGQLLTGAGFSVTTAGDGAEALTKLEEQRFDVMLLDIWLPTMSGLDLLGRLRGKPDQPKIIIMTGDDSTETLLSSLRQEAHQFVRKPIELAALLALIRSVVASPVEPHIVVLSARPAWVELLVPCGHDVADRIQSYIVNLDLDLPREIRETMGGIFRELLLDAMEWDGHLDPNRKVRIAYLRARKVILYRITDAGDRFRSGDLPLAADRHTDSSPQSDRRSGSNLLRPGALLARAEGDELLFNEARNEVVVVKYLE
jgi:CheY-like chemotaxis protein